MKRPGLIATMAAASVLALGGALALHERPPSSKETRSTDVRDTTIRVTAAMIEAGRRVYQGPGLCHACHGVALEGGTASPNLADTDWNIGDGSYADILAITRAGVAGTAMQPYEGGISDAQAKNVAAFVWAVSHGKAKP